MANTSSDHAIRIRIDAFLAELSELVRSAALGSVHAVLGGEPAPGRSRGPGRPRGSGRLRKSAGRARRAVTPTSKRVRRSAEDLEKIAARVLAHVKANAGHRLEQIGRALKVETAVLKRPIQNLLAGRKLRTTGQKRGTMYFAGGSGVGTRKTKVRRPTKRAGKAKVRRRRPAKRARKVSRKRAARRAAPRRARPAQVRKKKAARKPSRKARISPARAVATELAMDAAAMSSALP